jgi:3-oxoacyl-[acyl-carrier protein] reductase
MKTAIVTGAQGNLGRSFVETLVDSGYFVHAVDLNARALAKNSGVSWVKLDITDETAVKKFYRKIRSLDVLINNAGIGVYTPFEKRSAREFRKVMDVNLLGTFLMAQSAVAIMKKKKRGAIVNIGSIYGQVSSDPRIYGRSGRNNSEVYSATKAGVIMLTKYMAAHFAGYNIQINCISPGGILNGQAGDFVKNYISKTPAGRMASVTDVQHALKFLISGDAGYITGQNITVDGGFTAW